MKHQITHDDVKQAISNSVSMRGAANLLNLPFGTFKYHAVKFGLYKANQHGISHSREEYLTNVEPSLDQVLRNGSNYSSTYIKKRLLREGLKKPICESCSQDEYWNGKTLTFELDHEDGDRTNNRIENLKIICPNCHSTTPTWRGRNTKRIPVSNDILLKTLQKHKNIHKSLIALGMAPKGANYARARALLNARMAE